MNPPDRACVMKGSRFYFKDCSRLRIAIDGVEQLDNVLEYCVSKGWARVHVWKDGKKQPGALGFGQATKMLSGNVQVWWASNPAPANVTASAGNKG